MAKKCSNVTSMLFWLFGKAEEMDSAVSPASGFPQASLVSATACNTKAQIQNHQFLVKLVLSHASSFPAAIPSTRQRMHPFYLTWEVDHTSKFIHRPWNTRSHNTSQIQTCQNNLWANCRQFSYWLIFFFFKLMVIHAWSCNCVSLLSRFIRKFAISFHTFLCVTFHVMGPRR